MEAPALRRAHISELIFKEKGKEMFASYFLPVAQRSRLRNAKPYRDA